MQLKPYLLDATLSVAFWTPLVGVAGFIIGLSTMETVFSMAAAATNNFLFGAPFGRVLNKWRAKLHYN